MVSFVLSSGFLYNAANDPSSKYEISWRAVECFEFSENAILIVIPTRQLGHNLVLYSIVNVLWHYPGSGTF